jgi:hypothetical protein
MGLFSSAANDLKTAQVAKADAEASVAALTAQRAAKLEQDGDPVGEIAKIDQQIGTHQSKITIYASRIVALQQKLKRQHQAAREAGKRKWLSDVAKRSDRVIAAAEKLDRCLQGAKAECAELIAAERDVLALDCHDFLPRDKNGFTLIASLKIADKPALQSLQRLMTQDFSFAADASRMRKLLLEMLEETPVPEADIEAAA